ncbi:hypothetical protein NC652_029341 [Populus alba x Populus x berolinensis]|nr:hypothetical protein NC652_029341 [Populus alba x Populus x berolinensis]
MFRRIEPQESFQIRYSKTNKYHKNNHYGQDHSERHQYDHHLGYSKHDDFDERVLSPNKIKAPTFDGRHDPWIFDMWIRDMDQFFEWHNLSDNKRVRFAKMKLIDKAKIYWRDVEDCLEMRGKPPITDWIKMKQKLQEKYLPQSYRNKLLDQWNNLRQGNKSINEYIRQFNDYMIRCAIRESEAMTLRRFCRGLNDDLRREVVFQGVSTLNQAYTLVKDYKLVTKNQWNNHQDSYSIPTRSQFRSSDSLLGAPPHRPNPSSAQLCKKDRGKQVVNEVSKVSSKVKCINCLGFGHISLDCTSKPLVVQKHKDLGKEEYCSVEVYEPNLEDFSDLDDEDVQEEELNTMSPHELEVEVKEESDMSALMVEEILRNSSVESPIEISMVLEESHDICPPELSDSSPHMLGVQHIISLEQHVELLNPLPHARYEEDEDNPSLLDCVHTISTQVSNNVCLIPHPQSFSVHSYKLEEPIEHLPISPHDRMSKLAESLQGRVHNLHIEIMKQIQASNEQYKFRADFLKYHDALNVGDYFMIQIRPERCPLETDHKLQVSSARPFKVLQMITSNNYVIKLPLNFDINSTLNMKDLSIYKIQPTPDAPFDTPTSLSISLAQKEHINATLNAQVVFTRDGELQQIPVYEFDDQIQTILGLSKEHHNSLILVIESIIVAVLTYTRRGRVLPTPGELMGTPNQKYYLCTRMIIDDGG